MTEFLPPTDEQLRKILRQGDMIRERGLHLYQTLLGLDITVLARERVAKNGSFVWYDMACGGFDAGRDLVYNFHSYGEGDLARNIQARGIDLVTTFPDDYYLMRNVVICRGNVLNYPIPQGVDLITCLRGVRYVERYFKQGAQAVFHWYNSLPIDGILAFDYYDGIPSIIDGQHLPNFLKNRLGKEVVVKETRDRAWAETATSVLVTRQGTEPLIV